MGWRKVNWGTGAGLDKRKVWRCVCLGGGGALRNPSNGIWFSKFACMERKGKFKGGSEFFYFFFWKMGF